MVVVNGACVKNLPGRKTDMQNCQWQARLHGHGLLKPGFLYGGKDLTVLPAHTDYSLLQSIAKAGTDLRKWATEQHFTAWLGLAPGSHQSGKRKGSVGRKRNRAGR